ncbi:MAG: dihydroorotase [Saprospiraceae bacterium]|nr:dihydroorotase [Saprospiraceae bacterium]
MLFIKNARILEGGRESRPQDILVRDGVITAIADNLETPDGATVWEGSSLCVSGGWFDVGVQVCDPGHEHREDIASALAAAAAGGFTAIACFANTSPAIHSKSEVLYVKNKAAAQAVPVELLPIGAISHDCEGKDLAELIDMHHAGAVAFSDGHRAVQDAGLLLRALQYAQTINGLIFNKPHHKTIAAGGQMHEGVISTSLGLKAIPALAEELMVQRDLSLLEYAGGRLHIHLISTAKSVELIRVAKKQGLAVTCSVAAVNLCFTDEKMTGFDSNWKVLPPLRSASDVDALRKGLHDGVIDFICSNHTPWHEEAKNLEFPYADFGMTGLETAFSLCLTHLGKEFSVAELADKFVSGPRKTLGLPVPQIKIGEKANLTVFSPEESWNYSEQRVRSKSKNSPLIGSVLNGRVAGIVNGMQKIAL